MILLLRIISTFPLKSSHSTENQHNLNNCTLYCSSASMLLFLQPVLHTANNIFFITHMEHVPTLRFFNGFPTDYSIQSKFLATVYKTFQNVAPVIHIQNPPNHPNTTHTHTNAHTGVHVSSL